VLTLERCHTPLRALARRGAGACPVLFLGLLMAGACPTAPNGVADSMRATIDGAPWLAATGSGLQPPGAEYYEGDSALVIHGAGRIGGWSWSCVMTVHPILRDTVIFLLGDRPSRDGWGQCAERTSGSAGTYYTTSASPGDLVVTTFDTRGRLAEGGFAFDATNGGTQQIIAVTDGSFRLHFVPHTGEPP
jgi:hypothetical protein